MNRLTLAALAALLMVGCSPTSSSKQPDDPAWQKANAAKNVDEPDKSQAPGSDPQLQGARPGGGMETVFNLRSNQIRTRHLFDGSVTSGKMALVATTVTVAAAATAGSSAAATTIAGGFLIACTPAGNQDQFISNAVLNADGSITVTLKAAATAINTFRCVSVKPNAQGIS